VTGSYFEWTANLTERALTEEQFNRDLVDYMRRAFDGVWQAHLDHGVDLRQAAYLVGVSRVVEAMRLRGMV
jgi:glutamate dehydrogenase (NAD(P)+)